MRKTTIVSIFMILSLLIIAGCSDVSMSSTYSTLTDQQAAISNEQATRAEAANDPYAKYLRQQATFMTSLQHARDGTTATTPTATTAP